MANPSDTRTQNQPSHEAQVKGGQHSHQGNTNDKSNESNQNQSTQNQPSHEAQVKGGQHSHSGSEKK